MLEPIVLLYALYPPVHYLQLQAVVLVTVVSLNGRPLHPFGMIVLSNM